MGVVLAEQPDRAIRDIHQRVTKYVATSTPLDQDWANTTAIDGGLVEFVRDLKQQRGGDVGVHASISVAQALLAADVVDELRLAIGPMIAGRGRRLLDGLPSISSDRSEARPHRLAICSSTIALFVKPGYGGSCSSGFATRPSPR